MKLTNKELQNQVKELADHVASLNCSLEQLTGRLKDCELVIDALRDEKKVLSADNKNLKQIIITLGRSISSLGEAIEHHK